MVTAASGRRGFLRNVALAAGALLVGVGRSARGRDFDKYCSYCDKKCPDADNRTVCPGGKDVELYWKNSHPEGGDCVECYDSRAARAEAESETGCFYCFNVDCGFHRRLGSNGSGSSGQFSYEDPLGAFDSIGAGCYDPVTRETSPWSEPGDACSDLDAQETAPGNT